MIFSYTTKSALYFFLRADVTQSEMCPSEKLLSGLIPTSPQPLSWEERGFSIANAGVHTPFSSQEKGAGG
jgi:hypothetical protein